MDLYDWVDRDDPHPNRVFTVRRTLRLLIVVLVMRNLMALPVGFAQLVHHQSACVEQQRTAEREFERELHALAERVRSGEEGLLVGEAARRLMGLGPEE